MPAPYDVIVLGLGGIGSAIANDLASNGVRVLGLEQFPAVHDLGSSHGETRAIRRAYFENPNYIPLIRRAYELWEKYQKDSGLTLLQKPGCLLMGPEKSKVIAGCVAAAKTAQIPHEILKELDIRTRFGFSVPAGTKGFFEPDGGYLFVEQCIQFFIDNAIKKGADLRFEQKVESWQNVDGAIEVNTAGETFLSRKLVICLGAWTGKNTPDFKLPLSPKRTAMYWFKQGRAQPTLPVFFQETGFGPWIYGFPPLNREVKMSFHNVYTDCDPDTVKRTIDAPEIKAIEKFTRSLMPLVGSYSRGKACMYTMTPDENFVVGPLKDQHSNVFLACGFSGHGFKFAPAIGELASNFALGKKQPDIGFLSPGRFG
ncbi:MAG: N-methyl-L-tryptophan oxidase [Bdellovibrionia bacterium]